jgi:hypothetical protein
MSFQRIRRVCIFILLASMPLSSAAGDQQPIVRMLGNIDVKNFGSMQLRIGDLDGDGGPDLLLAQSRYATREITCLTALTIEGKVLWQMGAPSAENGRIYSDLPVQVYDWDADGRNEALYVRQAKYLDPWDRPDAAEIKTVRERAFKYEGHATMIVLDGETGREKAALPLPAGADDCFLFADLTGRGRREDLVVKDRYWNAWGVAHDGKVLWHWAGSTGHFPAVADVDGDGRDEVFFGYTLLDHDGKVLFSKDPNGAGWDPNHLDQPADGDAYRRFLRAPIHQDANYIVRPADGQWRLLFGNSGVHCLAVDGTEIWRDAELGEAQHVVAGRFRKDSPYQIAVIDRSPRDQIKDRSRAANLYLFDAGGKRLWKQTTEKGDFVIACLAVDWFGPDALQSILVYGRDRGRPAQLLDGEGKVLADFPMAYLSDRSMTEAEKEVSYGLSDFCVLAADVWGDAREEAILFGARGLCIYTNPRALANPTLYNETLYPGM